MSMSKLSANLAVISALADNPSETAAQLKAKFDQAGLTIGAYLNGTLTEEIDAEAARLEAKIDAKAEVAVEDSLTSQSAQAALSANQGRLLAAALSGRQEKIAYGTNLPETGVEGEIFILI